MTEEHSPWSSPDTVAVVARPVPPAGVEPAAAPPARTSRASPGYATGTVTRRGFAALSELAAGATSTGSAGTVPTSVTGPGNLPGQDDEARRNQRMMRRFMVAAAAILVVGLVVVLGAVFTGHRDGLLSRPLAGPGDTRPESVKRCPPPSTAASRGPVPPTPAGARTVDYDAGISYASYGSPWQTWDQVWSGGTLRVTYRVGQHFVTERGPLGDGYHASILSGSVPATVNDAMVVDLACTGRLVAADVRTQYYFQPNTMDLLRDEQVSIGGLPAWVTTFRLHFNRPGLRARAELVAVVLVDVGRPEAAILYVSIPGTNPEWDPIVDQVIDSVRPT